MARRWGLTVSKKRSPHLAPANFRAMRTLPLLGEHHAPRIAHCRPRPRRVRNTGDPLPTPRYADAASRGSVAAFFAGRPTAAQVEATTENWSRALGDSFACRVPPRHIVDAGLVGALEIAAMNAAASRGGEREIREGVAGYIAQLAALAVERRPEPSSGRCDALAQWAPRTADAGREAVARARPQRPHGRRVRPPARPALTLKTPRWQRTALTPRLSSARARRMPRPYAPAAPSPRE